MQLMALLRGVTPTGKNKIPKMSYLAEILQDAGFSEVETYIQSGNIRIGTSLSHDETASKVHRVIKENIGADLSVILKTKDQLRVAIEENPFEDGYDFSRIHLVFTNDEVDPHRLNKVRETTFYGEEFVAGSACFYLYLPREAEKKRLNTNYLERQLQIVATTRKLSVVKHLHEMLQSSPA